MPNITYLENSPNNPQLKDLLKSLAKEIQIEVVKAKENYCAMK